MTIAEDRIIAALRADQDLADISRALGAAPGELAAARDAFLAERARIADMRITAAVHGPVEILRDRSGIPHEIPYA